MVRPPSHWQIPAMHVVPPAHAFPHVPQFSGSELRSRHAPLHAASPAPHEAEQVPRLHTWPAAQACPHAPQFAGSEGRLTQAPAHTVSPAGQTHLACRHDVPTPHT
jgi:hypothetical protein